MIKGTCEDSSTLAEKIISNHIRQVLFIVFTICGRPRSHGMMQGWKGEGRSSPDRQVGLCTFDQVWPGMLMGGRGWLIHMVAVKVRWAAAGVKKNWGGSPSTYSEGQVQLLEKELRLVAERCWATAGPK